MRAATPRRRCARRRPPPRRLGVSKWELDTPALCVDLDKMDAEPGDDADRSCAGTGVASRPHAKTHKCPAIAKLQLAAGSIGVCTAKVSEAEALFANGVEKILMTTSNVTANKIRRAMKIRKANRTFIQAVDNPQNAQDLTDAAKEAGIVADVVVDVAVGTRRRAGRRTGARAGAARRQAAEPEAARDDQLRRQRAAHQGIHEARSRRR